MHAITSQPTTGTNVREFRQPDPMLAIERAMQQLIDSGRARFITLIATTADGHMTEIELAEPRQ